MTVRNCGWTRSRLPLLAGGELIGDERRQVERHLRGCADCRDLEHSHGGALAALRSASDALSIDAGLSGSLWPGLAERIRENRHPAMPAHRAWARWGLPAIGGLAAGLAAIAFWPRPADQEPVLVLPSIEQPAPAQTADIATEIADEPEEASEIAAASPNPSETQPLRVREDRPSRTDATGLSR
jgi:anti-sigma factor RsiW